MNYFEPRFFRDKAKGQDIFQQKLVRFGSANKDKKIGRASCRERV